MKSILLTLIITSTLSLIASADQLAFISEKDAIKAKNALESEKSVLLWCACCDNSQKEIIDIEEVGYSHTGYEDYYQVYIKGNIDNKNVLRKIDLAYTHIINNGKAISLGVELGLECDPCTKPFPFPENKTESNTSGNDDIEKYFEVFLNKNGNNLEEVFLNHQPSLNDCKQVFTNDFYRTAFKTINEKYSEIGDQIELQNDRFDGKTACKSTKFSTDEVISKQCNSCPGVFNRISEKFKGGITGYHVEFLDSKNSKYGSSYSFFTYLNGRWVYFPMN